MKTFIKQSIENKLSDINTITTNIANINKQIAALKTKGIESNDLLDKREALLQDLSKLTHITLNTQNNGMVDVMTPGGALVSGTNVKTLLLMLIHQELSASRILKKCQSILSRLEK